MASIGFAKAEVIDFALFTSNNGLTGFGRNLDRDYTFQSRCSIEIDSFAIIPNAEITFSDSAFKQIRCSHRGTNGTYSISYSNGQSGGDTYSPGPNTVYGLKFDADAKPLRFFGRSNGFDFSGSFGTGTPNHDTNGEEFRGADSDTSLLSLEVSSNFDQPLAVLIDEGIGSLAGREPGFIVDLDFVDGGQEVALINGVYSFFEGRCFEYNEIGSCVDASNQQKRAISAAGYITFDERLFVPSMRVTQAVFEDSPVIQLVDERSTAIIIDDAFSDRPFTVEIQDRDTGVVVRTIQKDEFEAGGQAGQFIFHCDADDPQVAYCGLETASLSGNTDRFTVILSIGDFVSPEIQAVQMIAKSALSIPLFFVALEGCTEEICTDPNARAQTTEAVESFIQATYPLPDHGINMGLDSGSSNLIRIQPTGMFTQYSTVNACFRDTGGIVSIDNAFNRLTKAVRTKEVEIDASGSHVAVASDVLRALGLREGLGGFATTGVSTSISVYRPTPDYPATVAEEIAHTYGLVDGYDVGAVDYDEANNRCFLPDGAVRGTLTSGYNVFDREFVSNARDFMGAGGAANNWVAEATWSELKTNLPDEGEDPVMLLVQFTIDDTGTITDKSGWSLYEGRLRPETSGDYSLVVRNADGVVTSTHSFSPNFRSFFGLIGEVESSFADVALKIEIKEGDTSIDIFDPFGLRLMSEDIYGRAFSSSFSSIGEDCFSSFSDFRDWQDAVEQVAIFSRDGNYGRAASLVSTDPRLSVSNLNSSCDLGPSSFLSRDGIENKKRLFVQQFGSFDDPAVVGDLDGDGDVDRDDLGILNASRNQPAGGPNDPKDLDGDGRITGLDGRKLVQLCTRRRCATE